MFYGFVGLFLMGLGIRAVIRSPDGRTERVLLLFGGRSAEHDVSRTTAVAVAAALDPAKYEVVPVAITTDGRWLVADEAQRMIEAGAAELPAAVRRRRHAGAGHRRAGHRRGAHHPGFEAAPAPAVPRCTFDVDVVFPLLHGPFGEDGTVQGLLELADLPYVGSGVVGSAVGMDKVAMKTAFTGPGSRRRRGSCIASGHDLAALIARVEATLGFPCFVKPANLGSSVGVSKARDVAELEAACELALGFDEWILVEEAIAGREIEVAVLGDDPPVASVPGEIVPGDDFYSYADKYEADDAELLGTAPLDDDEQAAARGLAVQAFEACRLESMRASTCSTRRREPTAAPNGLMVNRSTRSLGSRRSRCTRSLGHVGIPYPELLDRLIALAIAPHARRGRFAGRQR